MWGWARGGVGSRAFGISKGLPLGGAGEKVDEKVGGAWCVDQGKRMVVSYDNLEVARQKAEWVAREGLGGAMWWESSGDRKVGGGSLIEGTVEVLGKGKGLEGSENRLGFEGSKYENLRKGFPGE